MNRYLLLSFVLILSMPVVFSSSIEQVGMTDLSAYNLRNSHTITDNMQALAQNFSITTWDGLNYSLDNILTRINVGGANAAYTVRISVYVANASGRPNSASAVLDYADVTNTGLPAACGTQVNFDFPTNLSLQSGSHYVYVLSYNGTGAQAVNGCYNATGNYSVGNASVKEDGLGWNNVAGSSADLDFYINYTESPATNYYLNITARDNTTGLYIQTFNASISYFEPSSITYFQEQANVATPEGGLSTGSYTYLSSSPYFFALYSKPTTAYSAVWRLKYSYPASLYSYSIPQSCFDQTITPNKLVLRFFSMNNASGGYTNTSVSCLNNTAYVELASENTSNFSAYLTPAATTQLYDADYDTFAAFDGDEWQYNQAAFLSPNQAALYEEGVYWNAYNYSYVTINATTTTGNITVYVNTSTANITVESAGYSSASVTNHNINGNYSANLTPTSLNLTFYDENNGSLVNGTTITIYLSGSGSSYNYTTTTGSKLITGIINQTYIITYSASGYTQRTYTYTVTDGDDYIPLYMLSDSVDTIILATVFDTFGRRVNQANIVMQKKNLTGTNYYTVESCYTNALGNCLLRVYLYDTTYKFLIYDSEGNLKLDSEDTQIKDTTIQFTIVLADASIGDIYDQQAVTGNVSYVNSTSNFYFYFNDPRDAFQTICLSTEYRTGTTTTNYSTNCTTSNSTTLSLTINQSIGDEWTGRGYGYISAVQNYEIDSMSFVVSQFKVQFGKQGLYLFGFFVIGIAAFTGLIHPALPPIFIGLASWVFNSMGFISIGTTGLVSLLCIVIIIVVVNKKT